uniref:Uncharacterized protein n=1 Tax=Acrobeloides nanus TaxID=290746 RepID=A0A914DMX2_9BILA
MGRPTMMPQRPNTIGAPYVVRMDPNAILDETVLQLYSSMKNVTGHKRANLNRRNNQQAGPSGIRRHKGYKRS